MFKFLYPLKRALLKDFSYSVLTILILANLLVAGIIFFKSGKMTAELESKIDGLNVRQAEISSQINALQSNVIRLSAQIYRMQGGGESR